jgi:hypothetical protein
MIRLISVGVSLILPMSILSPSNAEGFLQHFFSGLRFDLDPGFLIPRNHVK